MSRFITALLRHRRVTVLVTFGVIVLGVVTLMDIKRDVFPEVAFGELTITTPYPGASPRDVELHVTAPIEDEVSDVPGVREYTSYSVEGLSYISVQLDPSHSEDRVEREVRAAVAGVSDFPSAVVDRPRVERVDTSTFAVLDVAVTGDVPYSTLRSESDTLRDALEGILGVSRVDRTGYRDRTLYIDVDPRRLEEYQLSLTKIAEAIERRNVRGSAGQLEAGEERRDLVAVGTLEEPEEAAEVIVRSALGSPAVRVSHVAEIHDGFADRERAVGVDGHGGITLTVYLEGDADAIRTVDRIYEHLDQTAELDQPKTAGQNPVYRHGEVNLRIANDFSRRVSTRFDIVLTNGLMGLAAVVVVLALALNRRVAFWVALSIPFTLLGVIAALPVFGLYLDTITLAAMVLLLGIIVDDSIIVSESIYECWERGQAPENAAEEGVRRVATPVLITLVTTFLAFAPLYFLPGLTGRFVRVIPVTVALALAFSALDVFLLLPAHVHHGLTRAKRRGASRMLHIRKDRPRRGRQKGTNDDAARVSPVTALVGRLLKWRYPIAAASLAFLLWAVWVASENLDFVLFPSRDAERFEVELELPGGASLSASEEAARKVEEIVGSLPQEELRGFSTVVGESWPIPGEHYASVYVDLVPFEERRRTVNDIIDEIRPAVSAIEPMNHVNFRVDTQGPPVGQPVSFRITGSDDEERARLAGDIAATLEEMPAVSDIVADTRRQRSQMVLRFDHPTRAQRGVSVDGVLETLRLAYARDDVTDLRVDGEDVGFQMRLAGEYRNDASVVQNLRVPGRRGRLIRIGDVAQVSEERTSTEVYRYNGERTSRVTAELDQDVATALEVQQAVREAIDEGSYPKTRFEAAGEAEESMVGLGGLRTALILALFAIYALLVFLFDSFFQPLLVLVAVPFGLAAVALAFVVHAQAMSFVGLLGAVGLSGVLVNDTLVLVNRINQLRTDPAEEQSTLIEIAGKAVAGRVRPILLTSVTTIVGVVPLAYGFGALPIPEETGSSATITSQPSRSKR